jgi:hypothetical protein
LALLALAFQLAISSGHVHLDHIALTSADATAIASAQPSSDDAPSSSADREDVADDLCPICALIHLAGALVPVEMPPLPLPSIFGSVLHEAAARFDVTAAPSARFRARAPPLA